MYCCTTNHPKTLWPEESLKNKTFIFAHKLWFEQGLGETAYLYPVRAGAAGLRLENTYLQGDSLT